MGGKIKVYIKDTPSHKHGLELMWEWAREDPNQRFYASEEFFPWWEYPSLLESDGKGRVLHARELPILVNSGKGHSIYIPPGEIRFHDFGIEIVSEGVSVNAFEATYGKGVLPFLDRIKQGDELLLVYDARRKSPTQIYEESGMMLGFGEDANPAERSPEPRYEDVEEGIKLERVMKTGDLVEVLGITRCTISTRFKDCYAEKGHVNTDKIMRKILGFKTFKRMNPEEYLRKIGMTDSQIERYRV